jgi:hypothetical protein
VAAAKNKKPDIPQFHEVQRFIDNTRPEDDFSVRHFAAKIY